MGSKPSDNGIAISIEKIIEAIISVIVWAAVILWIIYSTVDYLITLLQNKLKARDTIVGEESQDPEAYHSYFIKNQIEPESVYILESERAATIYFSRQDYDKDGSWMAVKVDLGKNSGCNFQESVNPVGKIDTRSEIPGTHPAVPRNAKSVEESNPELASNLPTQTNHRKVYSGNRLRTIGSRHELESQCPHCQEILSRISSLSSAPLAPSVRPSKRNRKRGPRKPKHLRAPKPEPPLEQKTNPAPSSQPSQEAPNRTPAKKCPAPQPKPLQAPKPQPAPLSKTTAVPLPPSSRPSQKAPKKHPAKSCPAPQPKPLQAPTPQPAPLHKPAAAHLPPSSRPSLKVPKKRPAKTCPGLQPKPLQTPTPQPLPLPKTVPAPLHPSSHPSQKAPKKHAAKKCPALQPKRPQAPTPQPVPVPKTTPAPLPPSSFPYKAGEEESPAKTSPPSQAHPLQAPTPLPALLPKTSPAHIVLQPPIISPDEGPLAEDLFPVRIVVDATPKWIGGYCIDPNDEMIEYYSVGSPNLPWPLINLSRKGNSAEFEMKNLFSALLIWQPIILKYKAVQIFTDNRAIYGKNKHGRRVRAFISHLKQCGGVRILNPKSMCLNRRTPAAFKAVLGPADDLSRRRVNEFVGNVPGFWDFDYEPINYEQVHGEVKYWETEPCSQCDFKVLYNVSSRGN